MSNVNAHKPGYKHTPLGWIPEEWSIEEFGKIAQISKSKYSPKENEHFQCVELEHLQSGFGTILGVTDSALQKSTKNRFCKGQILFGKLRPYLKKYWQAEFDGVCSSEIWVLDCINKNCTNNYLFYLVQQHRFLQAANVSSGSKMPRSDWEFLSEHPYSLPPLSQQQKIDSILRTWDKAIRNIQKIIAQLGKRNKGLVQQLLTPGKNWRKIKFSDVFDRVVQKNDKKNTNVVTVSAQRGFVKQNEFFNKTVASEKLDNYYLVVRGEFCYNKSYSRGFDWGAVKRLNEFEEAVVTPLYICFKLKTQQEFCSDFFEFFFDACMLDNELSKIAYEGGRAHGLLNVAPSDFFNIRIAVPEYHEQLKIANILSASKTQIRYFERYLEKMQIQKQALMQKLLTGEIRIKDIQNFKC